MNKMVSTYLPDEIWTKVFSRLGMQSLLEVEKVSQDWGNLINDEFLWRAKLSRFYPMAPLNRNVRDNYMRLWEQEHRWTKHGYLRRGLSHHSDGIVCLAMQNGRIFCGTTRGVCHILDMNTADHLGHHSFYDGCVSDISVDPSFLILGSMDGSISVVDTRVNNESWLVKDLGGCGSGGGGVLCVHHRDSLLVSSGTSGRLNSYDLRMMRQVASYVSDVGAIPSVRLTPDGSHVISGDRYGTLLVTSSVNLEFEKSWRAHQGTVMSLDMYDQYILSGSYDGFVKLWSLDEVFQSSTPFEEKKTIDRPIIEGIQAKAMMSHVDKVYNVRLVPELPLALTSCQDGTCHLWNLRNYISIRSVKVHEESIDALACDFEGFVTGSETGFLNLWNAPAWT
jgi:WD40 repeat protein